MSAQRCPCGEVHELPASVRAAYESVTAGLPPLMRVFVPDVGCWLVPRIYIAVHGLKADELPALAEQYGFAPHPHPGQQQAAGVTGTLLYEIQPPGQAGWQTLGVLRAADREGSITDTRPGSREIILFRCEGNRSVISRSAGGVDYEAGEARTVLPLQGRVTLAELNDGDFYERDVTSDRGIAYRARWTHRDIIATEREEAP